MQDLLLEWLDKKFEDHDNSLVLVYRLDVDVLFSVLCHCGFDVGTLLGLKVFRDIHLNVFIVDFDEWSVLIGVRIQLEVSII